MYLIIFIHKANITIFTTQSKYMSKEIRDMINKVKNFNIIKENNSIKKGVDFVYQQHPELNDIGTQQQYSKYLDTIFPYSKFKDIVYHESPNKFDKFRDNMFGIYFSFSPIKGSYGGNIHCAVVNVTNILVTPKPDDTSELKNFYNKEYREYNNPISFGVYKYDAHIQSSSVTKEGIQLNIRNSDQIHILGTEKDKEGFKKYIG